MPCAAARNDQRGDHRGGAAPTTRHAATLPRG
jgi:hypothetical protein